MRKNHATPRCVYYRLPGRGFEWIKSLLHEAFCGELAFHYGSKYHDLCNVVQCYRGFNAVNVCLVDREHSLCTDTMLLLLVRKKVRGAALNTVLSFALGKGWRRLVIHQLELWLSVLPR